MTSQGADGSDSGDVRDEFDPELDLLQRYEQMVQTQVETLNGIDDKAAYVARLVSVLTGLVLSAVSIIVSTGNIELTIETSAVFLLLGAAVSAFFVSLVYAIITYLSSKFKYGPTSGLGEFMADYRVEDQNYKDMMLRGYSEAIRANRRVVVTNSKRFEKCLASLLAGVLFLFGAGITIVLPEHALLEGIVVIVFVLVAGLLVRYIVREEYLTLERQTTN